MKEAPHDRRGRWRFGSGISDSAHRVGAVAAHEGEHKGAEAEEAKQCVDARVQRRLCAAGRRAIGGASSIRTTQEQRHDNHTQQHAGGK